MNKGEFIDRLADSTNLTKKEARRLLDSVLGLIQDTLLQGEEVKLVGFGKFGVRARKASSRINPQTKEQIHVDAKVVPCSSRGKSSGARSKRGSRLPRTAGWRRSNLRFQQDATDGQPPRMREAGRYPSRTRRQRTTGRPAGSFSTSISENGIPLPHALINASFKANLPARRSNLRSPRARNA